MTNTPCKTCAKRVLNEYGYPYCIAAQQLIPIDIYSDANADDCSNYEVNP